VLSYIPCHEEVWGSGGIVPSILNLGNETEWSSSCPGHFTLIQRAPSTHWTGGSVGPGGGLVAVAKRKTILSLPLLGISNTVPQPM